jgi:hypothetical protein
MNPDDGNTTVDDLLGSDPYQIWPGSEEKKRVRS